jgi:uncharacterized protein (TIGR00661 family)
VGCIHFERKRRLQVKILYGVVGEGMGHATRSRVVLEHLVKQHQVHVVVSGRAREYLAQRFEHVHGIWGYSVAYQDNSVKKWQTLLANVKGAVSGWPQNIRTYFELVEKFEPDVVISDFESFSYLFGKNHFLPVVSIDNMQVMNRCKLPPAVVAGFEDAFELSRGIVKTKLPGCFHYFITSFFDVPLRKERTTLVPSILRPEILTLAPTSGGHLVVYQTTTSNTALVECLKKSNLSCRIYGFRRDLKQDEVDGNLTFRPFSETQFIDDLRSCRGVIAAGGFTLMSEAVFFKKPMLSVPIEGQFEQVLNARMLEHLGYGHYAQVLNAQSLGHFIDSIGHCERALQGYQHPGNQLFFDLLDTQLQLALKRRGQWDETTFA